MFRKANKTPSTFPLALSMLSGFFQVPLLPHQEFVAPLELLRTLALNRILGKHCKSLCHTRAWEAGIMEPSRDTRSPGKEPTEQLALVSKRAEAMGRQG